MKKIYISGKMSGLPEENFPAFNEAAAKLRAKGFTVVNPAELKVDVTGLTGRARWQKFLKADLKVLIDCDAIVMLPGWGSSEGALLERYVARKLGLDVAYSVEAAIDLWVVPF